MKCVWPPPVRLMTRPPLNPIDGQSIILLAPSCARNGQGDDGSGRSGLKVTKTERPRFPSCVTSLPHRFPPREAESRRSSSVRSLVQKPASPASGGRRTHQSPARRCLSDRGSEALSSSSLRRSHLRKTRVQFDAQQPASQHFGAMPSGPAECWTGRRK